MIWRGLRNETIIELSTSSKDPFFFHYPLFYHCYKNLFCYIKYQAKDGVIYDSIATWASRKCNGYKNSSSLTKYNRMLTVNNNMILNRKEQFFRINYLCTHK